MFISLIIISTMVSKDVINGNLIINLIYNCQNEHSVEYNKFEFKTFTFSNSTLAKNITNAAALTENSQLKGCYLLNGAQ